MSENETKTIALPSITTVRDLAKLVDSTPIQVIKVLMANGVMANINQQIDFDTAVSYVGNGHNHKSIVFYQFG